MSYDLSVLIPANNEMFLARTIEDVIEHSSERTEVIAVFDGAWADPPVPVHPRVTVLVNEQPVGQRAATNQAARISEARYVMKLDAHCSMAPGFDVALLDAIEGHDDWTVVPLMKNLHAFDRVCQRCAHRRDQGPMLDERKQPVPCTECGGPVEREMIWRGRDSPNSTGYYFSPEPKFGYFGHLKDRPGGREPCSETMSLQGSCFMLSRERYWALDICDESLGSWGSQGIEVACKSWLSGGSVICVQTTEYAHMFRTQGGDFGFPYTQHGSQVERAKREVRELFFENKWPQQVRPLSWLIEKFWPVPQWEQSDLDALRAVPLPGYVAAKPEKEIVYYTENRLRLRLAHRVQKQLKKAGLPIVSVSLKPMPHFGRNVHFPGEPGILQMFKQILAGLEACEAETVFLCEHDVLYHPSHFDFSPERDDVFYYNTNVWKVRDDGFAFRVDDCRQTSGLCAKRELLVEHYRERVRRVETEGFSRGMGFEPGTHGRAERVDDHGSERWESEYPNVDVRHRHALTQSRWAPAEFRNPKYTEGWREIGFPVIPGWENLPDLLDLPLLVA